MIGKMTKKELYKWALQLAIPIMIQNLFNTLVNTADYWAVLVISHYS